MTTNTWPRIVLVQPARDDRTKRIPVIALTTCAWDSAYERALKAGCSLFLSKPCLPQVLADEIRRLLPNHVPNPTVVPRAA